MPTSITSSGITFNDATSLTSGTLVANSVGTTQIAANSVTAAKLGTTEQKQICKAWVNFNGTTSGTWAGGTSTVTRNAGSTTALVTTASPHGLSTNNTVYALTGVVAGSYTVTVLTTTTFTFTTVATTALSAASITFQGSTIRLSYNVSSVTKTDVGFYVINLAVPMSDSYFSVVGGAGDTTTGSIVYNVYPLNSSQVFLTVLNGSLGYADHAYMSAQIFGN